MCAVLPVYTGEELSAKHSVSLPAVAIAFAALPACVAKVVVGCSRAEEVPTNLGFLKESASVPASLWQEAQGAGLLPAYLPIA